MKAYSRALLELDIESESELQSSEYQLQDESQEAETVELLDEDDVDFPDDCFADDFQIIENDSIRGLPKLVPTDKVEEFIREITVGKQLTHSTVREIIHLYSDYPKLYVK